MRENLFWTYIYQNYPSKKIIKIRKELDKKRTNIICRRTLLSQLLNSDALTLSNIFLFPLIMTNFTYENIVWRLKLNLTLKHWAFFFIFYSILLQKYLTVQKKIKRSIPKQVQKLERYNIVPFHFRVNRSGTMLYRFPDLLGIYGWHQAGLYDHFWCQGWS